MKIGIIADTHIPVRAGRLPERVFEIFEGVDKIIHAGDLEEQRVIDELETIAPVTAVAGNMDYAVYGLRTKRILQADAVKIGIMHGAGGPRHDMHPFLLKQLPGNDIIIYGHTHNAFWGKQGGVWLMNPGSPTDTLFAAYRSVGLLNINGSSINGEIIRL